MNFEACVKFANERFVCSIATVDGDQPHVRNVGLWFADKNGFHFSTHKAKAFYRQLAVNPKVELSFYARPKLLLGSIDVGTKVRAARFIRRFYYPRGFTMDLGTMMRVTGTVEFVDDRIIERAPLPRETISTFDCREYCHLPRTARRSVVLDG